LRKKNFTPKRKITRKMGSTITSRAVEIPHEPKGVNTIEKKGPKRVWFIEPCQDRG